ncbi:Putative protein [Zobellia galactanivorans]|uniref:Uncharacterized protein n=1 Tax=Zobellia galactanivorans (strain DSM 12802 / CCUG 47099 / CIP 106680 / NCIMB 13871 / Dsij) TaxID=63186 RepID=G0LAX5_ZOBGA|nr:Putative protein [Zobellia galactanivorans]
MLCAAIELLKVVWVFGAAFLSVAVAAELKKSKLTDHCFL